MTMLPDNGTHTELAIRYRPPCRWDVLFGGLHIVATVPDGIHGLIRAASTPFPKRACPRQPIAIRVEVGV